MKVTAIFNFLTFLSFVVAVPRKRQVLSDSCSCAPDVSVFQTTFATVTATTTATVSTDAGGTEVTAATVTETITAAGTTTVDAGSVVSSTTTVGAATVTTTGSVTTLTITSTNTATTVTTCIPSAYKVKRQTFGASGTTTNAASSAPQVTTITDNFGSSSAPAATCVCRLISAFAFSTSTSTSPATSSSASAANTCSCSAIQTSTFILSSTVSVTNTITNTISDYDTSTFTPNATSTSYSYETITTTSTTIITVSRNRVTQTDRSTLTVTTTVTPTQISCPTADLSCGNRGLRWAIYANTNAAGKNNTNSDKTYSTFDPTLFKTRQPMYQNVTYTLGGFDYPAAQPVYISFYNSTRKFYSDYIVLNHVGYVFAQVTGTYTFSISNSDDITLLWVGQDAYSGYTRANANIVNPYGTGTGTYKVNFVAGKYYPIRIVFGNAQEAISFTASLTAPDGTVILTSNSKASPYLVQYSCDGTSAPPFAAFGSET